LCVQWLFSPSQVSTDHRTPHSKMLRHSKDGGGRSDPEAGTTRGESRSQGPSDTETTGASPTSDASDKSAAEVLPNRNSASEDGAKVGSKQAEGGPSGGCMPVGLTAGGELVFPMQCDEERHRAASPNPVPTNSTSGSAPKERQAAEPNSASGHEEQASVNSANSETRDIAPSGAARPNENSEPKADKPLGGGVCSPRVLETRTSGSIHWHFASRVCARKPHHGRDTRK
jgi:hypothetical protein